MAAGGEVLAQIALNAGFGDGVLRVDKKAKALRDESGLVQIALDEPMREVDAFKLALQVVVKGDELRASALEDEGLGVLDRDGLGHLKAAHELEDVEGSDQGIVDLGVADAVGAKGVVVKI